MSQTLLSLFEEPKVEALPLVTIWTDGACEPNPGPGGWSAIVQINGYGPIELSGAVEHTTNNIMELTGAIKGLELLRFRSAVTVWTDSQYLKDGASSWMHRWKLHNWTRGKKSKWPVKNVEEWKRIDDLCHRHQVTWKWIRGHTGHAQNERCDYLAVEAMKAFPRREFPSKIFPIHPSNL